jgi:hypothetical protein
MEFIGGMVTGVVLLVGYGAYRAVNSDGWDDSNVLNWLRLLSYCHIHPENFSKMFYLTQEQIEKLIDFGWVNIVSDSRPFDYISKDEFSENFPKSKPQ